MSMKLFSKSIYTVALCLFLTACKKLLDIAPPINSVTTEELFADNKQAEWAMAGIYSKMINGTDYVFIEEGANVNFAAGLSTIQGALSADEMVPGVSRAGTPETNAMQNKLTIASGARTDAIWISAYRIIFDANALIEGIEASTAIALTDSVRKQLTGEALAIRAFTYFYLVNFFGDVPLLINSDYRKNAVQPRSAVAKVYEQIKTDLVRAKSLLNDDYKLHNTERVRITKWFAEALLSRVYLYTGEYQPAIISATAVIDQASLFSIEPDLNNVFTPASKECIFQLKPSQEQKAFVLNNSHPEAYLLHLVTGLMPNYIISQPLLDAFEINDQRKIKWTETLNQQLIAAKYKRSGQPEYYTVMRLAEMYLIRAEARLLLSPANKADAIDDLNVLRKRADVDELDDLLTIPQVTQAIAHERRVELFAEWSHRWFDLKRTGKAHDVLSAIPYKQPWWGDYQFLYPIPAGEIRLNANLSQNPEYNSR
ncbi:SusD-like starch-binding protein associating with outer membrane [Pseudobacter ginsenosidimutans]|uniref:SusD-like starch-binding protein associating with outer membrane n=1 Tax=Pseudobacter ginsenosidimutans TaxID=661488 RepID=A0A4Q7N1F9_9BACT|nr:RagB/SusD family nutrient uptake outer membrane protein [Pseudobacter ginsenosidimutans]RZS75022.1 SusD-like starch-binding protein associating with outer membrane [Pseudobacter ginsenosidimutans]